MPRRASMPSSAGGAVAADAGAVAGVMAAMPVLSWAAVGDLSERAADLDYALRPPDVGEVTGALLVVGATVLLVACLLWLLRPSSVLRTAPLWWLVVAPLVVMAAMAGAAGRVMTAGVIGANIGAGLVVVIGGPAAIAVLLWCAGWSVFLVRRGRARAS